MRENLALLHDTIVAPATAAGDAAIAVVRLSGPGARGIAAKLTRRNRSSRSHELRRSALYDATGNLLDDAMVVEMHGPNSYTGEDIVELHLHGARTVVQASLAACQAMGARLAQPGEFTLRAFLHGRMDLAQAEAVETLVTAQSGVDQRLAAAHVRGALSGTVQALLESLEAVLADWRAVLDFPEYPTGDAPTAEHLVRLRQCASTMDSLSAQARVEVARGAKVVLAGAPNVGKSTLLNTWAGSERVLVDATPGTTRDPVDLEMRDGPLTWWLCDTAGMREEATGLEARGIALAESRVAGGDLVVWLVAGDAPVWPTLAHPRLWVVGSKADLADEAQRRVVEAEAEARGLTWMGWIAAAHQDGVDTLRGRIVACLNAGDASDAGAVLVKERHIDAITRAADSLRTLLAGHETAVPLDVLVCDLEAAAHAVGQILGRDVDAQVLDRIFSRFCIGK